MTYTQHALDCRDHEGCTAIVCTDGDGVAVWVSHGAVQTNPAERINPDVPALDKRGQQSLKAKGEKLTHRAPQEQ